MHYQRLLRNTVAGIVVCMFSAVAYAGQSEPRYEYSVAVQEIAQLYWLAETANTCGWATRQEADEFEAFAVRFLGAHLSGTYRSALISMTNDAGFQPGLQRVAFDNRAQICDQHRWRNGWTTYKTAADENAARY
jgi:hypothetical protein